MPFPMHTGKKGQCSNYIIVENELTSILKDGKTFLSERSEMSTSAPNNPKNACLSGPRWGWLDNQHHGYGEDQNGLVQNLRK